MTKKVAMMFNGDSQNDQPNEIQIGLRSGNEKLYSPQGIKQIPISFSDKLKNLDQSEMTFDPKVYEENNWCPVYEIGKTEKGGRVYLCSVTDSIANIHEYILLLDVLYHAEANDIIELNIASPGGYIATATQICTAIRGCQGTVICHASGMCASAGSLIWSVGHECTVGDGALFMWHMSSHFDWGCSLSIRDEAQFQIDYVREVLLSISVKRGFITEQEVTDLCTNPNDAKWITATEMRSRLESHQENTNPDNFAGSENPDDTPPTMEPPTTEIPVIDVDPLLDLTNTPALESFRSGNAAFASFALQETVSRQQRIGKDLPESVVAFESLLSSPWSTKEMKVDKPQLMESISMPRPRMIFTDDTLNRLNSYYEDSVQCDCNDERRKHQDEKRFRLLLSTTNNIHFTLYFTEYTDLDHPKFQNRLCKFLRTMTTQQSLSIHMGNGILGKWPVFSYGNIIDAIQRCAGSITMHVNGRAGFAESCLWLFGHKREVSEFGSLYFAGLQDFMESYPRWFGYFNWIYQQAITIGIINEEEVKKLMTSNIDLPLMQREVLTRIQQS